MLHLGYGDIFARNDSERLFSIVIMILGSTGLAYIVSEMSDHVFNKGSGKGQQDYKLSISRDYFIRNACPQSWRDALIKHFSFLMDKQTAFDHRAIWDQMPHSLRNDLIYHICQEDFSKITLFKSLKKSVLCTLYRYTEYCMLPQGSFMYTFETGSGGLYFVLKGFAEVIDEKDPKNNDAVDPLVVIASIQEGMFFGHEVMLRSTFDFLGIRARSDLFTLVFQKESIARMKDEVPLVYDALFYVIEEAVKLSVGTYDTSLNVGVIKRNISKILKMKKIIKKKEKPASHDSIFKRMMKWFSSDVNEAKALYHIFNRTSVINETKARLKQVEDQHRAVMSECSYEKFAALKAQRLENSSSNSPEQPSSKGIYSTLYSKKDEMRCRQVDSISSQIALKE